MKPVYSLSEDGQHLEMIDTDGELYTFDRMDSLDIELAKIIVDDNLAEKWGGEL